MRNVGRAGVDGLVWLVAGGPVDVYFSAIQLDGRNIDIFDGTSSFESSGPDPIQIIAGYYCSLDNTANILCTFLVDLAKSPAILDGGTIIRKSD